MASRDQPLHLFSNGAETLRSALDRIPPSGYDTASSSPRSRTHHLDRHLDPRKPQDSRVKQPSPPGRWLVRSHRMESRCRLRDTSETVATDVGGIPDIRLPGVDLTTPAQRPDLLADAILESLRLSPVDAAALSNGVASIETSADRILDLAVRDRSQLLNASPAVKVIAR